jgi:hypothetical protein
MQIRPNLSSLKISASKSETINGSEIVLKKGLPDEKNTAIITNTAKETNDMAVVAPEQGTLEELPAISSIPGLEDYK